MLYNLEFLALAKRDINNIAFYVSNNLKNTTASKKLVESFINNATNLQLFPYNSTIYRYNDKEYRRIKIKKYVMFFKIDEQTKTIIIVRILYHKMNFEYIFSQF